ncbi:MAG TPA: hypothetical protein VMF87_22405 [Streptosporangiaceae bacterium]|nr:hypothetical protein [Streptosporangiaceae bacterium]
MTTGVHASHGLRGRPGLRRAGVLSTTLVGAVVLAAACSGSSAGAGTFLGGTYAQSLAYAKCMRSHGVPNFPAPDAEGNFSNDQIDAVGTGTAERNAFQTCRSLLPNEGTGLSVSQLQAMQQQNLHNAVLAAHCMRAHGIAGFPDPSGSTQNSGVNWQPVAAAVQSGALNLGSPSYEVAFDVCSGKRVGGPIPPDFAPGSVLPSGPPPSGPASGAGS